MGWILWYFAWLFGKRRWGESASLRKRKERRPCFASLGTWWPAASIETGIDFNFAWWPEVVWCCSAWRFPASGSGLHPCRTWDTEAWSSAIQKTLIIAIAYSYLYNCSNNKINSIISSLLQQRLDFLIVRPVAVLNFLVLIFAKGCIKVVENLTHKFLLLF